MQASGGGAGLQDRPGDPAGYKLQPVPSVTSGSLSPWALPALSLRLKICSGVVNPPHNTGVWVFHPGAGGLNSQKPSPSSAEWRTSDPLCRDMKSPYVLVPAPRTQGTQKKSAVAKEGCAGECGHTDPAAQRWRCLRPRRSHAEREDSSLGGGECSSRLPREDPAGPGEEWQAEHCC